MNRSRQSTDPSPPRCITSVYTHHARQRMDGRGLPRRAVRAVTCYGRTVYTRNALLFVVGRKEVQRYARQGVDLAPYQGVHVVCDPIHHIVLTAYRNNDLKGLRGGQRRHSRRRR